MDTYYISEYIISVFKTLLHQKHLTFLDKFCCLQKYSALTYQFHAAFDKVNALN